MLRDWAALAAFAIAVGGCSFELSATTDGGNVVDDAPSLPIVGFAQATSTQDETSGAVMIEVTLAPGALGPVSVGYSFAGNAIAGTDYVGAPGSLTFAIGETTKSIPVMIIPDQEPESDEDIVISLVGPTGAKLDTTATHVMTISANTLPRVNLSTSASMIDEATVVMITLTLDKMGNGPATVNYTAGGGTAQPTGTFADYTLASGVVNFPTGTVMQTLPLGVVNDLRNELDESLQITLTSSTGVVLGPTVMQTHTILNNDAVPAVSFVQNTTTVTEGDLGSVPVMFTVTLSAASGRTVTVPFGVDTAATSMTNPSDYTLVGTSLTFAEGVITQDITVNVVADTISEPTEILALALTAPTDGSATLGTPPGAQLTITDDDAACVGVVPYRVCYSSAPAGAVTLPATIDTTTDPLCEGNQPQQWTATGQQNQPTSCVIRGTTITQTGTTTVSGTRPLVLAASGNISIDILDVASHRFGTLGPGATTQASSCTTGAQVPGIAAGGAGGSFLSIGGDGGLAAGTPGRAANPVAAPATLRAGCNGQLGDGGNETGKSGGVVYIVTGGTLTVVGGINASGSAALGGGFISGGSGGGSGGMIVLHATAISATGAAVIANGGGGASGGDVNSNGREGNDPALSSPTSQAAGGGGGGTGGEGGFGWAGMLPATDGEAAGAVDEGGGGGGGGGGYVRSNVAITGAMVSAGKLDIIP